MTGKVLEGRVALVTGRTAVNIAALIAITDRLAQPEGEWAPFKPPATLRHLFPKLVSWQPSDRSIP